MSAFASAIELARIFAGSSPGEGLGEVIWEFPVCT